jgi:hypothetical protein
LTVGKSDLIALPRGSDLREARASAEELREVSEEEVLVQEELLATPETHTLT